MRQVDNGGDRQPSIVSAREPEANVRRWRTADAADASSPGSASHPQLLSGHDADPTDDARAAAAWDFRRLGGSHICRMMVGSARLKSEMDTVRTIAPIKASRRAACRRHRDTGRPPPAERTGGRVEDFAYGVLARAYREGRDVTRRSAGIRGMDHGAPRSEPAWGRARRSCMQSITCLSRTTDGRTAIRPFVESGGIPQHPPDGGGESPG